MTKAEIWHNPRCSKSRNALGILEDKNVELTVVEYLKSAPTAKQIEAVLDELGCEPQDIIRTGESVYKESYKGKDLSRKQWIEAMVKHPILIERPIVRVGGKAVVGRPPENVLELL